MTPREVIERASALNARLSELAHESASLIEGLRVLDGEPIYDASVIREALRRLCERHAAPIDERARATFIALTDGDPEQRGPWSRRDVTRADDGTTGNLTVECDAVIREALS